jgi:uncharacterized membrane protein YtjA (UPF0391 family)
MNGGVTTTSSRLQADGLAWPREFRTGRAGRLHDPLSMLRSPFFFLFAAVIAAAVACSDVSGTWSTIAKILFVVCLLLFLVGLVTNRPTRV